MMNIIDQKNIPLQKKIRAMLLLKGISGAEIARKLGMHRTSIYKCIDGFSKSKKVRQSIASALGVEYSDLWGNDNKKTA
ncbi:hypothetical protein A45J_0376 [hot springs metagenome]|uniref:HTH cro/C1-type domain-containing protein n=1 Tax=hot springs metagenome TaxID=433727 RepID=A0A5J4KSJ2_9ZZZZ